MSKKLLVHLSVLLVLVLITIGSWSRATAKAEEERKAAEEAYMDDDYSEANIGDESSRTADVMVAVGIPFMITAIYATFLGVIYFLPAAIDTVSEEVIGSTAEVEDDGMHDARAAFAKGEYTEAIQHYRKVWEGNKTNRLPIVEVAKIQRENLESPSLAVDTLKEALESGDWRENDTAFFMFRIAEIYEDDLEQHEGAIEILRRVIEVLPDTRHAGNAIHKLRELGEV